VAVVGAGPVGLLTALALARRGYRKARWSGQILGGTPWQMVGKWLANGWQMDAHGHMVGIVY